MKMLDLVISENLSSSDFSVRTKYIISIELAYNVYSSIIHKCSSNWWKDTQIVECPDNGKPLINKKDEIMIYLTAWMNLKCVLPSEENKTKKYSRMSYCMGGY
jgi:predicted alpha/beta superfamily hydrolase